MVTNAMPENLPQDDAIPSLTKALEMAFSSGCHKISYRVTKSKNEDGKTCQKIEIDTIKDLAQELCAVMESADYDDMDQLRALEAMEEGTYMFLFSRQEFEAMKKTGVFKQADEAIRQSYLKNGPDLG